MYQINEDQKFVILNLIERASVRGLKEIEAVIDVVGALNNRKDTDGPNEEPYPTQEPEKEEREGY